MKELKWLRRSHENLRKEVEVGLSRVWEVENALAQNAVDLEELLRNQRDEMDIQDKMQLFIRWEGHTVMLGVGAHQSVFSVKSQLLDLLGVPVDQQQLLNAGRQLEDGHSLSCYGILEGSTLQLELRLQAGMQQPSPAPSLMPSPNPEAGGGRWMWMLGREMCMKWCHSPMFHHWSWELWQWGHKLRDRKSVV